MYLYIDETGDLGFSEKSSKYFIIIGIKIKDEETNFKFKRIIPKMLKHINSKKANKKSEHKFSNSNEAFIFKVLFKVIELDIEVFAIVINKSKLPLAMKKSYLIYSTYIIQIINAATQFSNKINITIDKCLSKSNIFNLNQNIRFNLRKEIFIEHKESYTDTGLQTTDFICGCFGYKYNATIDNPNKYITVILTKIKFEEKV